MHSRDDPGPATWRVLYGGSLRGADERYSRASPRDEPVWSDPVRCKKKSGIKNRSGPVPKKIRSKKKRSYCFQIFGFFWSCLGALPSDRAHREDSDGMDFFFLDALGPGYDQKRVLIIFCFDDSLNITFLRSGGSNSQTGLEKSSWWIQKSTSEVPFWPQKKVHIMKRIP